LAKYRDKLQIIAEILEIATDGAKKTHIMYQCNLSYSLLKRYLRDILRAELICPEDYGNCYVITEKGRSFLKKFENYVERSEKVNQQIDEVNHEKELLEGIVSRKKPLTLW